MDQPPNPLDIGLSLRRWLDINLAGFLAHLDLPEDNSWEMPVIEDFVLVVAVKDYKDGGSSVLSITPGYLPRYRTVGLLQTALNNGS